jgi:hypothetical protein
MILNYFYDELGNIKSLMINNLNDLKYLDELNIFDTYILINGNNILLLNKKGVIEFFKILIDKKIDVQIPIQLILYIEDFINFIYIENQKMYVGRGNQLEILLKKKT